VKHLQFYWLQVLLTVMLGCSSGETALQDESPVVLRLPVVAPSDDFRSMTVTPVDRSLVAGERVRIEGEYDANAISSLSNCWMHLEIKLESRGKSVIMDTYRFRGDESGKYGCTIEVLNRAGEYDLLIRISNTYVGRSRITVVDPPTAEG